jgi:hypothetical protein
LKKKTILLSITATVVALTLTGCGISSGTVTGKVVEPERRYSTTIMSGKVPITTWHTDDEDYCFDLEEKDETGYVCVDYGTFENTQVGDYYEEQ